MSARTVKQFQSESKKVEGTIQQTYMLPQGKYDMSEVEKMAYRVGYSTYGRYQSGGIASHF